MATAADTLARLRVCRDAGRHVPPDLLQDAIVVMERFVHTGMLRQQRDALIRRASMLLPGGRPYTRAGQLLQEARTMNRTWHILKERMPDREPASPRACLHAAQLLAPLPESQRHFYRVIAED